MSESNGLVIWLIRIWIIRFVHDPYVSHHTFNRCDCDDRSVLKQIINELSNCFFYGQPGKSRQNIPMRMPGVIFET